MIKEGTRTNKRVVVAGDFNAKSTIWGGEITDKSGRVLVETLCDYGIFPSRLNHRYTFYRNGRTSCLDIISATNELSEVYGGSKVLSRYSTSDRLYIIHDFRTRTTRSKNTFFKFVTKGLVMENFTSGLDEMLKEAEFDGIDEAVKADCLQRCIEGACESTLRKVGSAPNRKFCNY